ARIRLAVKRLAPALIALVAATAIVFVLRRREQRAARNEQALRMVTASDVVPLRLGPVSGTPSEAHGSYRTRPGASVAVLTTSHLPAVSTGAYFAWTHHAGGWRLLGTVVVESDGRSVLVAEIDPREAAPEEIRVTREPGSPGKTPIGAPVLSSLGSP